MNVSSRFLISLGLALLQLALVSASFASDDRRGIIEPLVRDSIYSGSTSWDGLKIKFLKNLPIDHSIEDDSSTSYFSTEFSNDNVSCSVQVTSPCSVAESNYEYDKRIEDSVFASDGMEIKPFSSAAK